MVCRFRVCLFQSNTFHKPAQPLAVDAVRNDCQSLLKQPLNLILTQLQLSDKPFF